MKWGGCGTFGLRLGVMIIVVIASSLDSANPSKTRSVQSLSNLSPYTTSSVEVMTMEQLSLQRSPVFTIPLTTSLDPVTLPSEIVREMLGKINKEEALSALRRLTGEEPICINNECYTIQNRVTGSQGLRWAKDYLYRELASLGYSVELRDWSLGGYSDQNLIARKVGLLHPEEEIYIVAHTDGARRDLIHRFPAADDNASGAVDLLEVARVVSNYSFDHTLVFFFSTGEEQGALGVKSYLQGLPPEQFSSIKYVINVDMVGYDEKHDGVMELWHGNDPASFALTQMMQETILAYQLDLSPELVVGCG